MHLSCIGTISGLLHCVTKMALSDGIAFDVHQMMSSLSCTHLLLMLLFVELQWICIMLLHILQHK